MEKSIFTFLIRIHNISLSLIILNFSGFEPLIILKLFLIVKGIAWSENQTNILLGTVGKGTPIANSNFEENLAPPPILLTPNSN